MPAPSIAAALLLMLGSPATRPPQRAGPVRQDQARAIREARRAQNRAIVAGDVERIASFWTEDVTIRRALGQDVPGRAAYRQLFAQDKHDDSSLVYQREPRGVEVSSHFPLAFETGKWVGHLGGIDGPVVIGGSYAAQWVRRDGHWLIRSEVYVALSCSGAGCNYRAVP